MTDLIHDAKDFAKAKRRYGASEAEIVQALRAAARELEQAGWQQYPGDLRG